MCLNQNSAHRKSLGALSEWKCPERLFGIESCKTDSEFIFIAESFADDFVCVGNDNKGMRIDLPDDRFQLVDLLRPDAGEQYLFFVFRIHAFAFDQRNAARAVADKRVGNLFPVIRYNIALLRFVQPHYKQVACFCAHKDQDQRIENIFGIAHGESAGYNDNCI